MKKSISFKRLSTEAEAFMIASSEKITKETNMGVFSPSEKTNMRSVYQEIVGRPAPTNCAGLCPTALKIVKNWLLWLEAELIPTVEELINPKSLDEYTKKELLEMYPTMSSRLTKAQIIAEIENPTVTNGEG